MQREILDRNTICLVKENDMMTIYFKAKQTQTKQKNSNNKKLKYMILNQYETQIGTVIRIDRE